MIFKNKIAELLVARNLKQADLCRLTGISTPLMSNYLTGKVSPSLSTAIQIADALNVTLDDLVGRSEGVILDADETELIAMYRELDETQKKEIFGHVDFVHNKKFVSKNSLNIAG